METLWRLPDARWNPLLLIDGPGHYSVLAHLSAALGTHDISLGGRSSFETSLSPVHLPEGAWWRELALSRTLACLLMMMWLLPAIRWCHRFSPDRLTSAVDGLPSSSDGVFGSIANILRRASAWSWLHWPARRALVAAARSPGLPAQVLAQTSALLLRNPFVIVLLPISGISGLLAPMDTPMYAQPVFLLCWSMAGIVISAIGSHEHQEGWSPLTQCVPGGAAHRFLRQWAAAVLLGNLVCAGLFASHAWHAPMAALMEQIAMLAFTALAIVLGQLAKSPRPFLFIVLTTAVLL